MKLRLLVPILSAVTAWMLLAASRTVPAVHPGEPVSDKEDTKQSDTIRISELTGKTQSDRPITVARAFRQGEIRNFARATVGGVALLTQCDVKNRWPDGSLKYALVSFVLGKLSAKSTVEVSFSNQESGNNEGYAKAEQLLDPGFDFDATIEMTGASRQVVDAREMLQKGSFRYWLQGPVVTAVIVEDRTPTRSFDKDFGDGSKALHPIFEAWFYPASKKVFVGYAMENMWASSDANKSMRDLSYAVTLRAGAAAPQVKFSQGSFTHLARTRWHKQFWIGGDAAPVRIDHNFGYWTSTQVIPNWDTSIRVSKSLVASRVGTDSATDLIQGDGRGIGNYQKDLRQAGASDWIGLAPLWDILYLYSMDERARRASLSNADLAGRIPWNYREADARAGSKHSFDAAGQIETFGRVVSVNARARVTLSDLSQTCADGMGADQIRATAISDDGWITTRDHMPDVAYIPYLFSGQFYYLESLQLQAAFIVGWKLGCTEEAYNRQGDEGFLHDTEVRGDAWAFRTLSYAAFISPDGSPEKAYFEDKLLNNIAEWEGSHDVRLSIVAKRKEWEFGHAKRRDSQGISPLGSWADRGAEFVQGPLKKTAKGGASPWEENFVVNVLGVARQFGYPTSGLLQFATRRLVNQVLNPATYPEYLEAYRYPTKNAADHWISTWQEYNSYYDYVPSRGQWRTEETVDHSYGFIAMAALSHLAAFSADGYSGAAAWDYVKAHKANQTRFATDSPKWALVPLNYRIKAAANVPEDEPVETPRQPTLVPSAAPVAPEPTTAVSEAGPKAVSGGNRSARVVSGTEGDFDQPGWHELPNTKLESVCPANTEQYRFGSNCMNVVAAWNGGIADQARNRLLIWGGGHNDYYGNEVYALDLEKRALVRLNEPSQLYPGPPPLPCNPAMPDGKPNARHTYGGLAYIAHADRMFAFGGIVACTNGGGSNDTWTLNLATLEWQRMERSKGGEPRTINGVTVSDYDAGSKLVYLHNTRDFYSYDFDKNAYNRLQFDGHEISYHMSGVIDPNRKLFILMGGEFDGNGGVKAIGIGAHGNHQVQDWNSKVKRCEGLRNTAYPGLAYDSLRNVVVGWAGGDSVYLFNVDSSSCSTLTFPGGPGPQQHNGTHGRFRYFEKLDVFALVNDSGQNAFVLRLPKPTKP
jgi:hypothetical protein